VSLWRGPSSLPGSRRSVSCKCEGPPHVSLPSMDLTVNGHSVGLFGTVVVRSGTKVSIHFRVTPQVGSSVSQVNLGLSPIGTFVLPAEGKPASPVLALASSPASAQGPIELTATWTATDIKGSHKLFFQPSFVLTNARQSGSTCENYGSIVVR
jgi:hypothetical protein